MPAQIFGNQALATQLYIAFNGAAPSNPIYENYLNVIATSGAQSLAQQIGNTTANIPAATLATTVLANFGVTAATVNATAYASVSTALTQIFQAFPVSSRGQIILNLNAILVGLEGNATYGAAASAWNNTTFAAYVYATNESNTSPGDLDNLVQQGAVFTLTAGVDLRTGTSGNDTFDGSVNAQGIATLTSVDALNGGDGTDLLIAGLAAGGNIAPTLTAIENAEFIAAGSTFNMVNTTGLQTALVRNSTGAMTFTNIGSTTTPVFTLQDQSGDLTLNFTNAALAGANSFTLNLTGAQSDAGGGADVAIAQQAGTDTTGLETLTIVSGGSTANFLEDVNVANAAGTSTLATLNVTGAQSLTISSFTDGALAASVRTVDASGMTGPIGLSAMFGATGTVTVTGSGGNDSLTFAANAANASINAGGGNDVISLAGFNTSDSVAGGDGTDRLDITAANAEAIAAALTNVTGFEQLSLNTAGTAAGAVNATRFGAIDTVRLDAGTAGVYGVTMQAGTVTVGVGNLGAGVLGGALTVTDTGTAADDVLNLTNRRTAGAADVFGGVAITSAGYETVNLSTGSSTTSGAQTTGLVTINNDSLSGANTLNISGVNAVTLAGVASNSSGLLTINASGLTGAATLTMGAAPTFTVATGTLSVTGSANADTLLGTAATASTIAGGAGNDAITGGTAADSLSGDAGNDVITGGGGNDTINGGDGNDTITVGAGTVSVDGGAGNDTVTMGATLTAGDVVVGGDGTDTLSLGAAATAATAAGVSGFETLTFTAAVAQGLEQFTTNSGFTRINNSSGGLVTITNASSSVATLGMAVTGGSVAFSRLVDTSSNELAFAPGAALITVAALTVNDEETLTVSTTSGGAASAVTFTAFSANDLTSLTVSGLGTFAGGLVGGAANLATVNASGNTGTVVVDASTSTANMTMTGSFSGANTLTGGTGADTITGGTAADSLTGGNGGDLINGGAGADTLSGGLGADVINGEIGNDLIIGGVGNDTLTGGEGADVFRFEGASNGVDTITDFVSTVDDLDVVTNGLVTAIANVTITTAAAQQAFVDDSTYFISMNGAAANLTTAGVATLSSADLTASTLTNVAAYLSERFTTAAGDDGVLVINWTAGGSTTSYVYDFTQSATVNTTIDAGELTLIGIVSRGTAVLVAGDVI